MRLEMIQHGLFDHILMDRDEAQEMYELEKLITRYPERAKELTDFYWKDMELTQPEDDITPRGSDTYPEDGIDKLV